MTYPGTGPYPALISRELLEQGVLKLPADTLPDAVVNAAVNGASGAVRDICQWRLDREVVTDYMARGDGSRLLLLPTKHLVSVDQVVMDGTVLTPFTTIDDPEWHYSVYPEIAGIYLRHPFTWPTYRERTVIDFTHGWVVDANNPDAQFRSGLPTGLESIIAAVAARSLTNVEGYSSLKIGQVTETYAGAGIPTVFVVSNAEKDQLAPYRLEP